MATIVLDETIQKSLEIELDKLIEDLKAKHIELGQKATGNWIDSLTQKTTQTKGTLYAQDYTQFLTKGRPPGKRPPITPLEKWVQVKLGLSGRQALGAAFAIANKIEAEGTTIFKQGGTDLVDGVITKNRIQEITDNIGQDITTSIAKQILR